jgi:methionine sulfoxide reductase heme-binding subunit
MISRRLASPRLARRLLRHHLPLGVLSIGSAAMLYVTRPYSDVITKLSFASAWPGLVLVAFTLSIGPFKQIWGRNVAVSQDFRRDVGIWAGMTGVFHAVIGNCVHLRGRPWLYYVYENWAKEHVQPLRHDIFGLANYTGLVSALVLLALLATSNDASLRKLGTPGWKSLQRWNYAVFGLVIVHTLAYQVGIERPIGALVSLAVMATVITLMLQGIGYLRRRGTI